MASDVVNFEFRGTPSNRVVVPAKVDKDSEVIRAGDLVTKAGATAGFVQRVDSNSEAVFGVAVTAVPDPGTVDGDATVMIDVSPLSVYEVRPSTGSVAQANYGLKFDAAANGATVLLGVTATNGDLVCIGVSTQRNTLIVRIDPAFTGYTP